jgi:CRP/FNR family cyclic AMP-dependent transcriptional regulator
MAGRVRLYTAVWGRELTVLLLGPGRLLNPLAWQDSVGLTIDAQACDRRTIVYTFPSQTLRGVLLAEPTSASQVLAQVSEACASLIEVLLDAAFQDATTRVAHTLGRLAQREETSSLRVTHQELAELTGLRREQVTRGLHQLRGEGYIAFQPHHRLIEVLDAAGLVERDSRAAPC